MLPSRSPAIRLTLICQLWRFILNDCGCWTHRHQSSLEPHRNDRACDLITHSLCSQSITGSSIFNRTWAQWAFSVPDLVKWREIILTVQFGFFFPFACLFVFNSIPLSSLNCHSPTTHYTTSIIFDLKFSIHFVALWLMCRLLPSLNNIASLFYQLSLQSDEFFMCLNVRGTPGRIDNDNKNMRLKLNTIRKDYFDSIILYLLVSLKLSKIHLTGEGCAAICHFRCSAAKPLA